MGILSRRRVLGSLAIGGAALSIANVNRAAPVQAQAAAASQAAPTPLPYAFEGNHQPLPLPFDPAKLTGISETIIVSHWENNYKGAIRNLNAIEKQLDTLARDSSSLAAVYGALKREESLRTGSMILHEKYFGNLGGDGQAQGAVLKAIQEAYGDYTLWEADFKKTAAALGGGSGWVVLTYNLHNGELHNYWSWDHMHNVTAGYPLLVLDMYEHAYHLDYGAAAAKYIDAFLLNVNWETVNHRFVKARKAKSLLLA